MIAVNWASRDLSKRAGRLASKWIVEFSKVVDPNYLKNKSSEKKN